MLSLALPRASVPFFVKEPHYGLLDGNTAFSTHLIELSCAFNIPHNPLVSEFWNTLSICISHISLREGLLLLYTLVFVSLRLGTAVNS